MKLVKEHIDFKRGLDPKEAMDIGIIPQIKEWLEKYKITNYIINSDLTINVNQSVNLYCVGLEKFPDFIQFNEIFGGFSCAQNNLTSLKGCPKMVYGDFYCSYNPLLSLIGCPKIVYGDFSCVKAGKIKFGKREVTLQCKVHGKIHNL